ncbi:hypothetical protein J4425_00535 [Candidatus Woesearchaeota archaeon]|nr:hypothetical protein [uncultured archaeon]MBS3150281.1 hypothetical protein [Candidatus Woesearchaeota archaeon]
MVEVDLVLKGIETSKEGYLDMRDLYGLIKNFLDNIRYSIILEKEHFVSENEIKIKIDAKKAINDYIKFVLKITITGSRLKKVKLKEKETYEGQFTVRLRAEIEKDYEDTYEEKPMLKFFRELFDYLVKVSDFNRFNRMIKTDLFSLRDEIKAYFEIEKLD